MAERVVTFTGPNEMHPMHQRKVIDLLFMELDLEIVHIKDDVYKIRKRQKPTLSESPKDGKRTGSRSSTKRRK